MRLIMLNDWHTDADAMLRLYFQTQKSSQQKEGFVIRGKGSRMIDTIKS